MRSRSSRGRATGHAGIGTSNEPNGTSGSETGVDKIAAGPVGLFDTVSGQCLVLGLKRHSNTKLLHDRALRRAERDPRNCAGWLFGSHAALDRSPAAEKRAQ